MNRFFTLTLLFVLSCMGLTVSLHAQSCSGCTYTSVTGTESYNLSSNQRVCIPSGVTFSGNINGGNFSNTSVCVSSGGRIQGANFNNFGGTLTNYGRITFSNGFNFVANGQTIQNYGRMTISNSINFNAKGNIQNLGTGHLVFTSNLTLSNGSTLTNEDSVIVQGNFNANSNSERFENQGFAIISGSYASSGTTVNTGFLIASNEINVNSGGTLTNECSLIMDGNFNNSGTTTNNGNILLLVSGGRFQNNSGAVFNNGQAGHIQGTQFVNNGDIRGYGSFRFTGDTRNNGGGKLGQNFQMSFHDTGLPAGGLDFQGGALGSGVAFQVVSPLLRDDVKSTCSSNLRQAFPVEFGEIEALSEYQTVRVNWIVYSEVQNDYFVVERSSDGSFFEVLGNVQSMGGHQQKVTYTFVDEAPNRADNRSYYRIRQVDIDGHFSYSAVAEARHTVSFTPELRVYPNPAQSDVQIGISEAGRIEILTPQGQRVYHEDMEAGQHSLSSGLLLPGIYLVHFRTARQSVTRTLVVRP